MSTEIELHGTDPLTEAEAEKLTAAIHRSTEHVWKLISEAYSRRAWAALRYDSWDDYCQVEFESSRIRLPREQRASAVKSLRESGLSIRAISAATGAGRGTVERDLAAVPNGTPGDPDPILGDRPIPPGAPTESTPGMTDRVQSALARGRLRKSQIVGTDGKSYSASKPPSKPRPRSPLPDAWSSAVRDLERVVAKLDRLSNDDRFGRSRETLRGKHDVIRARDSLDKLVRILDGDPTLPGVAE